MSHLYFAYGSNMSAPRLRQRVGEVRDLGMAVLDHYCHRFNKHGSDETAKGNIQLLRESRVYGVVYQLSPRQLELLDRFEGGYQRGALEVAVCGETLGCISYFGLRLADHLEPSKSYLDHYVAGARDHGLPIEYLREILPTWYRLP